jgi:hypothetical protein
MFGGEIKIYYYYYYYNNILHRNFLVLLDYILLFVSGDPPGADLWPHGVCAEAGRFRPPQAGEGGGILCRSLPPVLPDHGGN